MDREEFLEKSKGLIREKNRDAIIGRMNLAIDKDDISEAMICLHLFYACYPEESPPQEEISKIVGKNPWLFFAHPPSKEYLGAGISIFRKNLCHYLAAEYSSYRRSLAPSEVRQRVTDILLNLEKQITIPETRYELTAEELHFASESLQAGSLAAVVIAGFFLVSLTFRDTSHFSNETDFLNALRKAAKQRELSRVFDESDLQRAYGGIEKIFRNTL